jgi:hypothetical protein
MRVVLIAMPWMAERSPSTALASMASVIRRDTAHTVQCLHEYLNVRSALGPLYRPISLDERIGEVLYAAQLHPEGTPAALTEYVEWVGRERGRYFSWRNKGDLWPPGEPSEQFDRIRQITDAHLNALAQRIAGQYDVVGFTTSFCQLFASLVAARRLRDADPTCRIVLGGMGVAGTCASDLLRVYPFIDDLVQGEGEHRLVALLQAIEPDGAACTRVEGIVSRASMAHAPVATASVCDAAMATLDDLPFPDYSEYYQGIDSFDHLVWALLPVELSRGTMTRGSVLPPVCKSHERVAGEIRAQVTRHERLRLIALGDVRSGAGVESLARSVESVGITPSIACQLPTSSHPHDVLRLWEAGFDKVEFDYDTLSASYLRRTGTADGIIDILHAMRICYELGLKNFSSLSTRLPGWIAGDLTELVDIIRRFAICYQPLEVRRFSLSGGHAAALAPSRFGIRRLRNADEFNRVLPAEISQSLQLPWFDFECDEEVVDWSPLTEAVDHWSQLHHDLLLLDGVTWFVGTRPLYYFEGGEFMWVVDRRNGHRDLTLDRLTGDIYSFCMQVRSIDEVQRRFSDRCTRDDVGDVIGDLVAEDLMFVENGRVLSLAVAYRVELAVKRIRQAWREDEALESGGPRDVV